MAAVATVGLVLSASAPAAAYVGPGAGLSLLGSLLWLLLAILTAIGIILYWPIRVLIRWIRGAWPARTTRTRAPRATPERDEDESAADSARAVESEPEQTR